ncbi:hypothetical protein DEI81_11265 [Curtobacterium sp. MCBD17_013]|uniref:hypothetical protein n=1 Tax=Curtobacterium sp. MCBD17_013 TaxID=2175668 RepID=UPI000DAAC796|nr:hypothetical protein [Curtobacterium sp. MCBD17_013]PZF61599.1 hypothetical protein DEI81_11265 [Curtobacterium sp. MCBD17_013]
MELRQVFQPADYQSAFEADVAGFSTTWWGQRLKRATDVRVDTFSVFDGGDELARVEVDPNGTIFADYLGLRTPMPGAEVTFFEVRADRRRSGIGRAAVRFLRAPYADQTMFAFSEGADVFWASVGWRRFPRADGDAAYRPLFVSAA